MEEIVILDGTRTAFGSFGGSLKDKTATELGVFVSTAVLQKTGVEPKDVDECIFGNVIQSSKDAIYLARHIALRSGIPITAPALTVNRLCGSGLEAIIQGFYKIALEDANCILAGGTESMSQAPHILRGFRWGVKYGHGELEDSLSQGLLDIYTDLPMGLTAENLASEYNISREEQDDWAAFSQERAEAATQYGILKQEITPFPLSKSELVFEKDEFIRGNSIRDKLPSLKPAFKEAGTVTAGNSSGINDGAGAVLVASKAFAQKIGKHPLAIIKGYGHSGCDPVTMGIGPVFAIPKALKMAGLSLSDIGLVEVNEAFAAQFLAVQKKLGLDKSITNINGGAIAIGHPLGASGNRVVLTLAYEMKRRKIKYGVASLCIGGGQGIAIVLQNPRV
jgi:acetyl-CoA acetyltransferase family protein